MFTDLPQKPAGTGKGFFTVPLSDRCSLAARDNKVKDVSVELQLLADGSSKTHGIHILLKLKRIEWTALRVLVKVKTNVLEVMIRSQ